jgi:hypothetical protein
VWLREAMMDGMKFFKGGMDVDIPMYTQSARAAMRVDLK